MFMRMFTFTIRDCCLGEVVNFPTSLNDQTDSNAKIRKHRHPQGWRWLAIALVNKIARIAWAMMTKGERYKEPVALAA